MIEKPQVRTWDSLAQGNIWKIMQGIKKLIEQHDATQEETISALQVSLRLVKEHSRGWGGGVK